MDGAHPSPKTDRDHLMKDNLGCYCPKTFETAKGKKENSLPDYLSLDDLYW